MSGLRNVDVRERFFFFFLNTDAFHFSLQQSVFKSVFVERSKERSRESW